MKKNEGIYKLFSNGSFPTQINFKEIDYLDIENFYICVWHGHGIVPLFFKVPISKKREGKRKGMRKF